MEIKTQKQKDIFHVAIDGPVASGKGTVAKGLAARLGISCLDTGAMYRGFAIYVRDNKINHNDEEKVVTALDGFKMDVKIADGITRVSVGGKDVTDKIRENDISQIASTISTYKPVRKFMVAMQQEIARQHSFILEGRDICSVILPDAAFKFYLTANIKTRAERRMKELNAKGQEITLKEMIRQIKERDSRDMKKGGLKQVREAIVVDNTKLNCEQTIDLFYNIIMKS